MINRFLQRWLETALWLRLTSFFGLLLLLYYLLWLSWLRPVQQSALVVAQQNHQLKAAYLQRLATLRRPAPFYSLTRQIALLNAQQSAERQPAFSLASLLAVSGGTLEKWRPSAEGGVLELQLSWQQFSRLTAWLHSLKPAPGVPNLLLQRHEAALHLRIELRYEK